MAARIHGDVVPQPRVFKYIGKDGNVFRRQLLWKENNLTYFKSWNTARTSKAAPGFLASRGSTEGWSRGEVAAGDGHGSSTVPSNSKAIFTGKESGLIEDLPKSISIFDFFPTFSLKSCAFVALWIKECHVMSNFRKYFNFWLAMKMKKDRKMIYLESRFVSKSLFYIFVINQTINYLYN